MVMKSKPTRLPPLILQSPDEALPFFHEDWTRVEGTDVDLEKWEMELRLREARNRLIHQYLTDGRSVWYKSSGNSMWPLVQSGDACTFHPIQAVTDTDGRRGVRKEASKIGVGDIVFCQVQCSNQYYANIVLKKERDNDTHRTKYWIGDIKDKYKGWCHREHIYGILVQVKVKLEGRHYTRPLPKTNFEKVRNLIKDIPDSLAARRICDPRPAVRQ